MTLIAIAKLHPIEIGTIHTVHYLHNVLTVLILLLNRKKWAAVFVVMCISLAKSKAENDS